MKDDMKSVKFWMDYDTHQSLWLYCYRHKLTLSGALRQAVKTIIKLHYGELLQQMKEPGSTAVENYFGTPRNERNRKLGKQLQKDSLKEIYRVVREEFKETAPVVI